MSISFSVAKKIFISKRVSRSLLVGCVVIIFGVAVSVSPLGCERPVVEEPTKNAHGYRTWDGHAIRSFDHHGGKICIPEGWFPVGMSTSGFGWASFPKGETAVIIDREAFVAETVLPAQSRYKINFIYPKNTLQDEVAYHRATINHTYTSVGALFADREGGARAHHTVLVTANVEKNNGAPIVLYPDPSEHISFFIHPREQSRSEELFTHAVVHLYNRFSPSQKIAYQDHQSPIPRDDFQELEATWAEIIFRTSEEGRGSRLTYLFNVHRAVFEKNYSRITSPPFNNPEGFQSIIPNVVVPGDASFLSAQYGHYILGPLVMVAIDGVLHARQKDTDVKTLLTTIHKNQKQNFFDLLAEELPTGDMNMIYAWMNGSEAIPAEYITQALERYDK